jgi:hypothetical protein
MRLLAIVVALAAVLALSHDAMAAGRQHAADEAADTAGARHDDRSARIHCTFLRLMHRTDSRARVRRLTHKSGPAASRNLAL